MYFYLHFSLLSNNNGMHAEVLLPMNNILSGKIYPGPVILG